MLCQQHRAPGAATSAAALGHATTPQGVVCCVQAKQLLNQRVHCAKTASAAPKNSLYRRSRPAVSRDSLISNHNRHTQRFVCAMQLLGGS
jgi:hypothetical protein